MSKHYGVGTYKALRLTPSAILIIAFGQAPNLTTHVTLEQLPWRIFPPWFALFFDEPPISLPATRPFLEAKVFPYPKGKDTVTIIDAGGVHTVGIVDEFDFAKLSAPADGKFLVYQQLGRDNCIVVPEDALVPAIFARAFGPASESECVDWAKANCGK